MKYTNQTDETLRLYKEGEIVKEYLIQKVQNGYVVKQNHTCSNFSAPNPELYGTTWVFECYNDAARLVYEKLSDDQPDQQQDNKDVE